jgi:hypothetical protein
MGEGKAIKEAIDGTCSKAKTVFEEHGVDYSVFYDQYCSFVLEKDEKYVNVYNYSVQRFTDSVDIRYIDVLKASSDTHPTNVHIDGRTMHVFILLQKNPTVVWQLRLSSKDDPSGY